MNIMMNKDSKEAYKPLDFNVKSVKTLAKTPCGKDIVSMVLYNERLVVATKERVYCLSESGVFTRVLFEHADD